MRAKLFVMGLGLAVATWLMAPTVASAQVDHYACYQVKDLKMPDKLVKNQAGTHSDAVTSGTFEKCKLKFLCSPTSKDGSVVNNPSADLLCHQCKGFKGAVAYDISDQFVNGRVETKKLKFICNPGTKTPA